MNYILAEPVGSCEGAAALGVSSSMLSAHISVA